MVWLILVPLITYAWWNERRYNALASNIVREVEDRLTSVWDRLYENTDKLTQIQLPQGNPMLEQKMVALEQKIKNFISDSEKQSRAASQAAVRELVGG